MAWNDTFTTGLQWQDHTFLGMFEQAIWERQQAIGSVPFTLPTYSQTTTAVGQVVQGIIKTWQAAVFSMCTSYFKTGEGDDLTGVTPSTWASYAATLFWTEATLLDAIGKPDGFTRKYERRFATLASSVYADTSAFADGHLARCQADWKIYSRTAGAWVLTTDTTGDTVTAYGLMVAGDYIGEWCFNELRDALNLLERTKRPSGFTTKVTRTAYNGVWYSTLAAAIAASEALWPASGYLIDANILAAAQITRSHPDNVFYPNMRQAAIGHNSSKVTASVNGIVPVECDVWLFFQKAPSAYEATYDNQGDHLASENTYWKWQSSITLSGITQWVSAQFSDVTTIPPTWGSEPAAPPAYNQITYMVTGYLASDPIAIATWTFTQRAA